MSLRDIVAISTDSSDNRSFSLFLSQEHEEFKSYSQTQLHQSNTPHNHRLNCTDEYISDKHGSLSDIPQISFFTANKTNRNEWVQAIFKAQCNLVKKWENDNIDSHAR